MPRKPFEFEGARFTGPTHWIRFPSLREPGPVTVDGRFFLYDCEPEPELAVLPRAGTEPPTLSEVASVAHALAYEHDVPCGVSSKRARALERSLIGKPIGGDRYSDTLGEIEQLAHDQRWGGAVVRFRRPARKSISSLFDVPLSARYANSKDQIRLYNTALRQVDPLSEFLNLYRILEASDLALPGSWAGKGNGKQWITNNIARISTHAFGRLMLQVFSPRRPKPVNAFARIRQRAKSRIAALAALVKRGDVAAYLYNQVRCGIAHGKSGVWSFDFAENVRDARADVSIVKLLARIAIDDAIPPELRRRASDDGTPLLVPRGAR